MDKELEEAIKRIKILLNDSCNCEECKKNKKAYKTVLKELEALQETIESKDRLLAIITIELNTAEEELERLQEENNKPERANKTYINSIQSITPVLLEDYIAKDEIREKIEEMQEEFNKLDKETDKYLKEKNRDLTKYYEQKERTAVMQTVGWAIGKFKELLEEK